MCFSRAITLALLFGAAFMCCHGLTDSLVSSKRLRPGQTHAQDTHSLLKTLEFKHRLRVCNAYPSDQSIDIFMGKQKITTDGSMAYQSCQDLKHVVKPDDSYDFKLGGEMSVGTFAVSNLPNDDAVMLLVIHRHDKSSTSAAFESHVYSSNLPNAQVAVVDTFKGSADAGLFIRRATKDELGKTSETSEPLRYNSVVAVKPGEYECALTTTGGIEVAKKSLVALGKESYVVIRTGVDAKSDKAFPQALTVFPASDAASLGAAKRQAPPPLPSTMFIAFMGCMASSFLLH